MKKLFILCMITMMSVCCSLQAQKRYIGGSLGLNYQLFDGVSKVGFLISPEFGYRFNDMWTLGGNLEVSVSSNDGYSMTGMALTPYVRNTFGKVKNFEFFAEGAFGYMVIGDGSGPYHGFTLAVRPGVLYKAKKVDIMGKVNLIQYSYVGDIGSLVNLSVGNTLSIGVVYNF